MNKLLSIFFCILVVQACSEAVKEPKLEVQKNDCFKVELQESGIRLFLPAGFLETNNKQSFKTINPDTSQTQNDLLNDQPLKSRFFALNGDTTQLLILIYGHGVPKIEVNKASAGVISGLLKETSIRAYYMQGYNLSYGKSKLSILPKVSFLKLEGTYALYGSSEKGILNMFMLSTKFESVMVILRTKKEIQLEKYLEITELL